LSINGTRDVSPDRSPFWHCEKTAAKFENGQAETVLLFFVEGMIPID
jgi:hypothetical protein